MVQSPEIKFYEKYKIFKETDDEKDINILLLGETGIGKSTFINAVANYLQYKYFEVAEKLKLISVIPSTITVTNKNNEQITVRYGSNNNEDETEDNKTGTSTTENVKTYIFPLGNGKTRLRFIDTPGIGDTRGIQQDDINCSNILTYLTNLEELHGICFFIKPNNSRINVFFNYCIKQIFSRLEKSATENLIFIFTNTKGTHFKPGETLPCLKKIINEIEARSPHVNIPFNNDNIFCVDNDCFRYLLAAKNGVKFDREDRKDYMKSWVKSSKECWRLVSYLAGDSHKPAIKPHHLKSTISINEARRVILYLAQPLADISQLIHDNLNNLKKYENSLAENVEDLEELKKKLYIPRITLEVTELEHPVTVCTGEKCAKLIEIGNVKKWNYIQKCHDPCYLPNVQSEIIGAPGLVNCSLMWESKKCRKCKCPFSVHMHTYYITTPIQEKIIDQELLNSITDKETALEQLKKQIIGIRKLKRQLEREREVIISKAALFAHFLQKNAVTTFDESYKSYIVYQITHERKLGPDANQGTINDLENLLVQYDEIKRAYDSNYETEDINLEHTTTEKIYNSFEEIYKLKHNGDKLRELYNKQRTSRMGEYEKYSEYIHANIAISNTVNYVSSDESSDESEYSLKLRKPQKRSTPPLLQEHHHHYSCCCSNNKNNNNITTTNTRNWNSINMNQFILILLTVLIITLTLIFFYPWLVNNYNGFILGLSKFR